VAETKGVLVDTDILIDISRNKPRAVDFFDGLSKEKPPVFISIISAMELMVGARNKKRGAGD
jgi:predicted nucleic acid-binding protein